MKWTDEFVIYDLEYTTWPGALARFWSGDGEHREIVWIGAVRVDIDTLKEIDFFECIIKPTVNPVLSDYFIELTKLDKRKMAREGVAFIDGIRAFHHFIGKRPMCSYGWDGFVILENFKLNQIPFNASRPGDPRPVEICIRKGRYHHDTSITQFDAKLRINLYDRDSLSKGFWRDVRYEVDLDHGKRLMHPIPYININLKPWLTEHIPEIDGLYSGQIAAALGEQVAHGHPHSPLYDSLSILQGIRHLTLSRNETGLVKQLSKTNSHNIL